MPPDSELTYTPGVIRVNVITQVVDYPDVKIWEIDLKSKYPEETLVISWSDDGAIEEFSLVLYADENTLRPSKRFTSPTEFMVAVPADERWQVMTYAARYTARFAVYRENRELVE